MKNEEDKHLSNHSNGDLDFFTTKLSMTQCTTQGIEEYYLHSSSISVSKQA